MRVLVEKIESIIDDDSLHDAMEIAHGLNWVRHELEPELKNPQARYYVGEAEYYLEGLVDDYIALIVYGRGEKHRNALHLVRTGQATTPFSTA